MRGLAAGASSTYVLPMPDETKAPEKKPDATKADAPKPGAKPTEHGGPKGPEPTRYGDWEKNGRCIDF
jgi:hypothetical protein